MFNADVIVIKIANNNTTYVWADGVHYEFNKAFGEGAVKLLRSKGKIEKSYRLFDNGDVQYVFN